MYWIPKHLSRYCTTHLPYISRNYYSNRNTVLWRNIITELEKLKKELNWYKENYNTVCNIVYRISDSFIPGYYTVSSCNGTQCCQILADEIIKFASKRTLPKK